MFSESRAGSSFYGTARAVQADSPEQVLLGIPHGIPSTPELTAASLGGVNVGKSPAISQGSRPSCNVVEDMMLQLLQDPTVFHGLEGADFLDRSIGLPCISDYFSH